MVLLDLPWEMRQAIWQQLLNKPGKICTRLPLVHLGDAEFTWSYSQLVPILTVCKAVNLELTPLLRTNTTILDLFRGSEDLSRAPSWVYDYTSTLIRDVSSGAPIFWATKDFKQMKLVVLETYIDRESASDMKPEKISDAIKALRIGPEFTWVWPEEVVTLLRVHANRLAGSGRDMEVEDTVVLLDALDYTLVNFERHSYTSLNVHERPSVGFRKIETLEDYLAAKDASSRQNRDNGSGGHCMHKTEAQRA